MHILNATVRVYGDKRSGGEYSGTGFVVNSRCHVVTCWHVIENAKNIFIRLPYEKAWPAEIIATLPEFDLALIQSMVPPTISAPSVNISREDWSSIKLGERVAALGYSTEEYYAAPRHIAGSFSAFSEPYARLGLNIDLNEGDSGAPVFNEKNVIVGVASAIDVGRSGHAMAIPAKFILALLQRENIPFQRPCINTPVSPFHPVGTLPTNYPIYIKRECDAAIAEIIKENRFIGLSAPSGMGKSSLLVRMQQYINAEWSIWYQDCNLLRLDTIEAFTISFFQSASRVLGKASDFHGMISNSASTPTIIILDEFGSLEKFAPYFLPGLCAMVSNQDARFRIIAALPVNIVSFLKNAEVTNSKHLRVWTPLNIQRFGAAEVEQLLGNLQEPARTLAQANIEKIVERSKGLPREIQELCNNIFSCQSEDEILRRIDASSYA